MEKMQIGGAFSFFSTLFSPFLFYFVFDIFFFTHLFCIFLSGVFILSSSFVNSLSTFLFFLVFFFFGYIWLLVFFEILLLLKLSWPIFIFFLLRLCFYNCFLCSFAAFFVFVLIDSAFFFPFLSFSLPHFKKYFLVFLKNFFIHLL